MTWLERDLASAREIQRTFLPPLEQEWRGVRMVAEYRPAHAVGGDFFEVVRGAQGRLTAVVGDVAGKGIAAALIMARVSAELRRFAGGGCGPREILRELDGWLGAQALGDRFVTAACVQLDLVTGTWMAASAGHPQPLLRRRDGAVIRLAEGTGLPLGLGLTESWEGAQDCAPALPGDVLVMMTDGLEELLPGGGPPELFGREGLPAGRELEEVRRRAFTRVAAARHLRDDATLLGLRVGERAVPVI